MPILLEFDAEGTRYSEHARLKEAVTEYRQLKTLDEDFGRRFDDNVLYDLWYSHHESGRAELRRHHARYRGQQRIRRWTRLALRKGVDSAPKRSLLEITTDDQDRGKALAMAGLVLIRVRKYAEGSALLAQGARGQADEVQLMRRAALFSKTKPYEEIKMDPRRPA